MGAGLGLFGAIGLSRMTTGLLFGVRPTDPATYLAIAALLAATVLLACWLPARRAADIGPMMAIRCD
jgi:putative ABC transport system permease protein